MPSNWVQAQPVARPVLSSISRAALGGRSALALGVPSTGSTFGGSNILLMPLQNPTQFSVRRIFWLNGATVNGNVEVAVYDLDGRQLVTSGSTAMSGANVYQGVVKSYELAPGNYWLAFATSSATASFPREQSHIMRLASIGLATHTAASPVPMPSTITAGSNLYFGFPIYGLSSISSVP